MDVNLVYVIILFDFYSSNVNLSNMTDFLISLFVVTDIAAQKEHDRRVAEAAVAKARIEWERQMQQNTTLKQQQQQPAIAPVLPAPTTTIIHSGKHRIQTVELYI